MDDDELDNTSTSYPTEEKYARLGEYVGKSRNVFKCPADIFAAAPLKALGLATRCRSLCGNINVGEGNYERGPTDLLCKHIKKMTDFIYPPPVDNWVCLDEHPDSINDAGFFNPHQTQWIEVPAIYHIGAGGFSFADGHAEIHGTRLPRAICASFPLAPTTSAKRTDGLASPRKMAL